MTCAAWLLGPPPRFAASPSANESPVERPLTAPRPFPLQRTYRVVTTARAARGEHGLHILAACPVLESASEAPSLTLAMVAMLLELQEASAGTKRVSQGADTSARGDEFRPEASVTAHPMGAAGDGACARRAGIHGCLAILAGGDCDCDALPWRRRHGQRRDGRGGGAAACDIAVRGERREQPADAQVRRATPRGRECEHGPVGARGGVAPVAVVADSRRRRRDAQDGRHHRRPSRQGVAWADGIGVAPRVCPDAATTVDRVLSFSYLPRPQEASCW